MKPRDEVPAVARAAVVAVVPLTGVALLLRAMEPFHLVKWWLAVVGAVVGGTALAIRALRTGMLPLPPKWFIAGVTLFATALVVSVATAEEQMRAVMGSYSRWTGAGAYLAYLTIALLTALVVVEPRWRNRLGSVVLATAGAVLAYALIQRVGLDPVPWEYLYGTSTASFLGNPNFASAYMGIPIPLVGARIATSRSRRERNLYSAFAVSLLVGQWTTTSWLGPFATAVGLGATVVVLLVTSRIRIRRRVGAALALAGPIVAGTILYGFWNSLLAVPDSVSVRLYYWRTAIDMLTEYPATGVGLSRFAEFFRLHRPADGLAQFGESFFADNPHSSLLTLAAEGGLLLAAPWLVLMGAVAWSVVGWVRGAPQVDRAWHDRLVVAGWGGAFGGYVVQSLASFDVPALAVLGYVLAGGVAGLTAESTRLRLPGSVGVRRGVGYLVGLGAATLVVLATVPLSADVNAGEGARQAQGGNLTAGVQHLDLAAKSAPWESRYLFGAGQVAYAAGDLTGAQRRFEATAATFPRGLQPVLWSARVAAELGQMDRAADWYRQALVLAPDDGELAAEARAIIESESSTP